LWPGASYGKTKREPKSIHQKQKKKKRSLSFWHSCLSGTGGNSRRELQAPKSSGVRHSQNTQRRYPKKKQQHHKKNHHPHEHTPPTHPSKPYHPTTHRFVTKKGLASNKGKEKDLRIGGGWTILKKGDFIISSQTKKEESKDIYSSPGKNIQRKEHKQRMRDYRGEGRLAVYTRSV